MHCAVNIEMLKHLYIYMRALYATMALPAVQTSYQGALRCSIKGPKSLDLINSSTDRNSTFSLSLLDTILYLLPIPFSILSPEIPVSRCQRTK